MTRARAVLAATLFAAVLGVATAAPAAASDWWNPSTWVAGATDCRRAPIADSPDKAGDVGPAAPRDGNPWTDQNPPSIYDVYGLGGRRVIAYDQGTPALGCSQINPAKSMAQGFTDFGNELGTFVTAVTVNSWRWVSNGSLTDVLNPIQAALSAGTSKLFLALIGFVLIGMGIWWTAKSNKMRLSAAGRMSGTSVLVLACVAVAMAYPLALGPAFARGVNATLAFTANVMTATAGHTTAQGALDAYNRRDTSNAGDAIGTLVVQEVLYPTWVNQTFGAENPEAGKEFGPRLFEAGTLSRTDQKLLVEHPDQAETVYSKKRGAYDAVAAEVMGKYPAAYSHVVGGNDVWDAWTQGAIGVVALLVVAVFLLAALWEIALAIAVVMFACGLAPVIGLASAHPAGHPLFWRVLGWVKDRCLKGVVAAVGVFLFTAGCAGPVLRAGVPLMAKLMLLAVCAVTLWRLQSIGLGNIKGTHKRLKKVKSKTKQTAKTVETGAQAVAARGEQAGTAARAGVQTAGAASWSAAKGAGRGYQTIGAAAGGAAKKVTGRVPAPVNEATARQAAATGAKQGAAKTAAVGALTGGTVTVGAAMVGAAKGAARAGARSSSPPALSPVAVSPAKGRRRDHWHSDRPIQPPPPERIAHHAPVVPR